MRTTWRTLLLVVSLPLVLGVACDPQAPGAVGQLTLSSEGKSEAGRTLEIRFVPDDGKPFDIAIANLVVEYPHRQASWNLDEIEFPFYYAIGGGLGSSEHEHWRVVAWIAESAEVDRPIPGEWWGTRVFPIGDCGIVTSKFCGVMRDIDFELDSQHESSPSANVGGGVLKPGD